MTNTISTNAVTIGNAMLASGVLGDIALFHDKGYLYLAVIGAFVSTFGVIHELTTYKNISKIQIVGEILKGLTIGFLAIPFWYLFLSAVGDRLISHFFGFQVDNKFTNSFWFIISFYLSWYSVPIFNWIVKTIPKRFKDDRDM